MGEEAKATCGILSDIIIGKSICRTLPIVRKGLMIENEAFSFTSHYTCILLQCIKFSKKINDR